MATNPNWPVVTVTADFSQGPPNNTPGVNGVSINSGSVAVTDFTTKRGRQYELDTFEAGTAQLTVSDPAENLNPANTSSPWNSGANKLKPYRLLKIQAQWPPVTGTTYDVYTGYIERYPQTWDDAGARGIKPLQAVDAISIISRTEIAQSYDAEVNADNPVFRIPLDDTSSPGLIDGLAAVKTMSEFTVQGSQVQWGGDTFPDGTKCVTLSQQVQDFTAVPNQFAVIDCRLPQGPSVYSLNLANSTIEMWVKLKQGSSLVCFSSVVDGVYENPEAPDFFAGVCAYGGGPHFFGVDDPQGAFYGLGNIYPDNKWHHWVGVFKPSGSNYVVDIYIDGALYGTTSPPGPARNIGINSIHAHASTENGDYQSTCSVAQIAAYNYQLSATRILAHYQRGTGYFAETASGRQTRLLNQYWSSDTGKRTVYPTPGTVSATGIASDVSYDGRTLLDVLQEICLTDAGRVYADKSGRIVCENKNTRDVYSLTSVGTFGEQEFPYEDLEFDFDPTYVYSQSNLTSPSYDGTLITVSASAQADYGQRILSQTMQTISGFRLVQAGIYFQFAYSNAVLRIEKMILNPAANTALWPIVLGLEISQRMTIKRRTSQGTVISADHYVEAISHTVTGDGPSWITEVEFSPVFVNHPGFVGDTTYGKVGTTAILAY